MAEDSGPARNQPALAAAPALGAAQGPQVAVPVTPPRGKRYKRNPARQLFPAWKYPADLGSSDGKYFEDYRSAISGLVDSAMAHDNYGPVILAVSERMYDDELARRESINTRSSAVLSTGGILGALFVAAGQLGLMQKKGSYGIAAWIVLAIFLVALAYLGVSIAMALAVHGARKGWVADPKDLAIEADSSDANKYNIHLAKVNLEYTVNNYGVNNVLKFRLHSAQRCLRNGIIAIILAGMLSPLALHSASSTSSGLAPGNSAGKLITSTAIRQTPNVLSR